MSDKPSAEGQCIEFTCAGEAAFAIRHGGKLYAYLNQCPHTGAPLNWSPGQFLDAEGEHLMCSLHGALFRIEDGYCIYGPCAGAALTALDHELCPDWDGAG